MALEALDPVRADQPIYQVIKREDLVAAFREAMASALTEVLETINKFIDIYTSIEVPALWTWGYSSRWDYDMWW